MDDNVAADSVAAAQSIAIQADIRSLRRMSAWLQDAAGELGIPSQPAADLDLCANEAVTNIISYGYDKSAADAAQQAIVLHLTADEELASLTIVDDAQPFNPLEPPIRADPDSLADAPVGGLGIRLIRSLCMVCRYSRKEGRNRLEMQVALTDRARSMALRGVDRRRSLAAQLQAADRERRSGADRRQYGGLFSAAFFRGIAWYTVESAFHACQIQQLEAGQLLLDAGQANHSIFVLVQGQLSVRLPESEHADSIVIRPGGSIGELSIIDGKPVSAHVTADVPSEVAIISSVTFWNLLMPVPGFARNVLRLLSDRMRANNDLVVARMREHAALEQLHKELGVAREIQSSMLPPRGALVLERGGAEVHGLMVPARDIGGDFYDAFLLEGRYLVLIVGDVSGKGIPAALFMARTVAVLRNEAIRARRRPSTLLERANAQLCINNETGMFVTLLVAVLDMDSGELQYSNAGHLAPCLRRAGGEVSFLPQPQGMLAGISSGARYATETLQLAAGDSVLLYTDGVTEAVNPRGDMFGDERLTAALASVPDTRARSVAEHVQNAVAAFVQKAPTADDITLLAVQRQ